MANNYRQFSSEINDITAEEEKWLTGILEMTPGTEDAEALLAAEEADLDFAAWPGFDYRLENGSFWFYGEEYGNVDHAAALVRVFLKKFRPDDSHIISWADTCSRPLVGEFGGGAVFITAYTTVFENPIDEAQQLAAEFKNKEKKPPTAPETNINVAMFIVEFVRHDVGFRYHDYGFDEWLSYVLAVRDAGDVLEAVYKAKYGSEQSDDWYVTLDAAADFLLEQFKSDGHDLEAFTEYAKTIV